MTDVGTTLEHMHDAGLVHGGVRPSHIVQHPVTQAWTLIDLTYAAKLGERYLASKANLLYNAPELKAWNPEATAALDAWSLGVVACELITGQPWEQGLEYAQVLP